MTQRGRKRGHGRYGLEIFSGKPGDEAIVSLAIESRWKYPAETSDLEIVIREFNAAGGK